MSPPVFASRLSTHKRVYTRLLDVTTTMLARPDGHTPVPTRFRTEPNGSGLFATCWTVSTGSVVGHRDVGVRTSPSGNASPITAPLRPGRLVTSRPRPTAAA